MLPTDFTVVDLETTGARVTYDRIIEVGVIRAHNGKIVDSFHTLLNPHAHISPFIESLTGIKKEELENAPDFGDVKEKLIELLKDSIFVAHNVRFDYGFLKNEFKRAYVDFSSKQLCTVKLSRKLFPHFPHHDLDSIIQRFNLTCKNRHRAFDDAKATWDFLEKIMQQIPTDLLDKTISTLLRKPSLPTHLSHDSVANLPASAGVYIFYSEKNMPLYIGKSINIKDRVHSHFLSDYTSSSEMHLALDVHDIKTIKTAGELGALLTESELIKKMQPIYNRKLRDARKLTVARRKKLENKYDAIELVTMNGIEISQTQDIFGVFKSIKQAKSYMTELVKTHSLCEKLLGLQSTRGACFAHQLGWCKGACAGKEKPLLYNMRLLLAFTKTKLKSWPFERPIRITETSENGNLQDIFFIDQWCVIKRIKIEGDDSETYNFPYRFDVDTYKILLRYILDNKNSRNVQLVDSVENNYLD